MFDREDGGEKNSTESSRKGEGKKPAEQENMFFFSTNILFVSHIS